MRTSGLSEADIWLHGDQHVGAAAGRPLRARADVKATAVRSTANNGWRLDVNSSPPPPRHALIVGWPPPSERDARKNLAQLLRAQGVQLVVRPVA